ncbi:MAG: hypothetical protein MUF47_13845 [Porphyrobacter sp.]|jgi:hypothetical protein|nr:hypothetical protein [Porphyrobacter sp.]
MTEQRKTLLAIAAMLLLANAVALFIVNMKAPRQPDIWFGYADEIPFQFMGTDPRMIAFRGAPFRLTQDGAQLHANRVGYHEIVRNFGRSATERELASCTDYCVGNPWFAWAIAENDTTLATVIAATRAIRNRCNTEVVIFGEFNSDPGLDGMPIFFAPIKLGPVTIGPAPLIDTSLKYRRINETLEQFGERTGCARVSPLQP